MALQYITLPLCLSSIILRPLVTSGCVPARTHRSLTVTGQANDLLKRQPRTIPLDVAAMVRIMLPSRCMAARCRPSP